MKLIRTLTLFSIAIVAGGASAEAQCPPWRPCGSGNTWGGNRFVQQGFYGADFRPACAKHDECLQSCSDRRSCDQQFKCDMYDACECSCNPAKCRCKARCYYCMARMCGWIYRRNQNCCCDECGNCQDNSAGQYYTTNEGQDTSVTPPPAPPAEPQGPISVEPAPAPAPAAP